MTTLDFLSYLQKQDIQVWADGDRLLYSASEGALTPELKAELVQRKAEILDLLQTGSVAPPPALRTGRDGVLPLSFAQERLWFLQQLQPDSTTYHIPIATRLSGPLDVGALRQSLEKIARRHEVLRTTFPPIDGQPVQVIGPAPEVNLPVVDLQGLPEIERETEIQQLAVEAIQQPIDLGVQLIAHEARVYGEQLNAGIFYWATGLLSGFLDNAPTYLNFLSAEMGKFGLDINVVSDVRKLSIEQPLYLTSISVAAVFFGAMTYIGNGPNFMVKSICERAGIKMPSFFAYWVKYAIPILIPVFILVWLIFFNGG